MFEQLLKSIVVDDDPYPIACQECKEQYCPGLTVCEKVAVDFIKMQAHMAAEVEYDAETEVTEGFDFFEGCIDALGCDWFPEGWTSEKIRPVFNEHAARMYAAILEG